MSYIPSSCPSGHQTCAGFHLCEPEQREWKTLGMHISVCVWVTLRPVWSNMIQYRMVCVSISDEQKSVCVTLQQVSKQYNRFQNI